MKKSKLVLLGIFVLALNLIWEFSHYRLYIDLTGIPSTAHLIIASFTDLLLITFIFAVISIFRKKINWIENPKKAKIQKTSTEGTLLFMIPPRAVLAHLLKLTFSPSIKHHQER